MVDNVISDIVSRITVVGRSVVGDIRIVIAMLGMATIINGLSITNSGYKNGKSTNMTGGNELLVTANENRELFDSTLALFSSDDKQTPGTRRRKLSKEDLSDEGSKEKQESGTRSGRRESSSLLHNSNEQANPTTESIEESIPSKKEMTDKMTTIVTTISKVSVRNKTSSEFAKSTSCNTKPKINRCVISAAETILTIGTTKSSFTRPLRYTTHLLLESTYSNNSTNTTKMSTLMFSNNSSWNQVTTSSEGAPSLESVVVERGESDVPTTASNNLATTSESSKNTSNNPHIFAKNSIPSSTVISSKNTTTNATNITVMSQSTFPTITSITGKVTNEIETAETDGKTSSTLQITTIKRVETIRRDTTNAMTIENNLKTTENFRYPRSSITTAPAKQFSQHTEISLPELSGIISERTTNEISANDNKRSTKIEEEWQTVGMSQEPRKLSSLTPQSTTIIAERVTTEKTTGSNTKLNEISKHMRNTTDSKARGDASSRQAEENLLTPMTQTSSETTVSATTTKLRTNSDTQTTSVLASSAVSRLNNYTTSYDRNSTSILSSKNVTIPREYNQETSTTNIQILSSDKGHSKETTIRFGGHSTSSHSESTQTSEISNKVNGGIFVQSDVTKMFYNSNRSTEFETYEYETTPLTIMEGSKYTTDDDLHTFFNKSTTIDTSRRTVSQKEAEREDSSISASSSTSGEKNLNVTAKYLTNAGSGEATTIDLRFNDTAIPYISPKSFEEKSSTTFDNVNYSETFSNTLKHPHMSPHGIIIPLVSATSNSRGTQQAIGTIEDDVELSTTQSQTFSSDRPHLSETNMDTSIAINMDRSIDRGSAVVLQSSVSNDMKYISSSENEGHTHIRPSISRVFNVSLAQSGTTLILPDKSDVATAQRDTQTPHPATYSTTTDHEVGINRSSNPGNAVTTESVTADVSGHMSLSSDLRDSSEEKVFQTTFVPDEAEAIEEHRTSSSFESIKQSRDVPLLTETAATSQASQLSSYASPQLMLNSVESTHLDSKDVFTTTHRREDTSSKLQSSSLETLITYLHTTESKGAQESTEQLELELVINVLTSDALQQRTVGFISADKKTTIQPTSFEEQTEMQKYLNNASTVIADQDSISWKQASEVHRNVTAKSESSTDSVSGTELREAEASTSDTKQRELNGSMEPTHGNTSSTDAKSMITSSSPTGRSSEVANMDSDSILDASNSYFTDYSITSKNLTTVIELGYTSKATKVTRPTEEGEKAPSRDSHTTKRRNVSAEKTTNTKNHYSTNQLTEQQRTIMTIPADEVAMASEGSVRSNTTLFVTHKENRRTPTSAEKGIMEFVNSIGLSGHSTEIVSVKESEKNPNELEISEEATDLHSTETITTLKDPPSKPKASAAATPIIVEIIGSTVKAQNTDTSVRSSIESDTVFSDVSEVNSLSTDLQQLSSITVQIPETTKPVEDSSSSEHLQPFGSIYSKTSDLFNTESNLQESTNLINTDHITVSDASQDAISSTTVRELHSTSRMNETTYEEDRKDDTYTHTVLYEPETLVELNETITTWKSVSTEEINEAKIPTHESSTNDILITGNETTSHLSEASPSSTGQSVEASLTSVGHLEGISLASTNRPDNASIGSSVRPAETSTNSTVRPTETLPASTSRLVEASLTSINRLEGVSFTSKSHPDNASTNSTVRPAKTSTDSTVRPAQPSAASTGRLTETSLTSIVRAEGASVASASRSDNASTGSMGGWAQASTVATGSLAEASLSSTSGLTKVSPSLVGHLEETSRGSMGYPMETSSSSASHHLTEVLDYETSIFTSELKKQSSKLASTQKINRSESTIDETELFNWDKTTEPINNFKTVSLPISGSVVRTSEIVETGTFSNMATLVYSNESHSKADNPQQRLPTVTAIGNTRTLTATSKEGSNIETKETVFNGTTQYAIANWRSTSNPRNETSIINDLQKSETASTASEQATSSEPEVYLTSMNTTKQAKKPTDATSVPEAQSTLNDSTTLDKMPTFKRSSFTISENFASSQYTEILNRTTQKEETLTTLPSASTEESLINKNSVLHSTIMSSEGEIEESYGSGEHKYTISKNEEVISSKRREESEFLQSTRSTLDEEQSTLNTIEFTHSTKSPQNTSMYSTSSSSSNDNPFSSRMNSMDTNEVTQVFSSQNMPISTERDLRLSSLRQDDSTTAGILSSNEQTLVLSTFNFSETNENEVSGNKQRETSAITVDGITKRKSCFPYTQPFSSTNLAASSNKTMRTTTTTPTSTIPTNAPQNHSNALEEAKLSSSLNYFSTTTEQSKWQDVETHTTQKPTSKRSCFTEKAHSKPSSTRAFEPSIVSHQSYSPNTTVLLTTGDLRRDQMSSHSISIDELTTMDAKSTTAKMNSLKAEMEQITTMSTTTTNEEEITTTLAAHCKVSCPTIEWREGKEFCYRWLSQSLFSSYDIAMQYCHYNFTMIGIDDFLYAENIKLFMEMSNNRTNLIFLFASLTAEYKKTRMVNIANMEQSTIFQVNIARQVQNNANVSNVGAICKLTKYCAPIVCDISSFIQNKQIYLELPSVKSIPSGKIIDIPCKADPSSIFNITYVCTSTGEFQPHPSDKRCVPTVETGTESCVPVNGGFKCICKEGWTMLTCWMAPTYCRTNSCSVHGTCVEMINYARCACDEGWKGSKCTLNAAELFNMASSSNAADVGGMHDRFDDNEVFKEIVEQAKNMVVLFNWVQGGLGLLAATALLSSTVMAVLSSGCDDSDFNPQTLFQSHRLRSVVIAAVATFYARNPHRYSLDIYYGCRFYYWLINTAYAVGQCLWMAEAMNVEKMFGSTQFNRWKRGQSFNDKTALTYLISLPPCYIVPFVTVATAMMTNWKSVCRPSSCIGSFSEDTFPLQMALIALNGALMIASIALCESAYLIRRHCMEREITRCEYFLSNWPYELGKSMMNVERNLPFIPIGSILHFACWMAVTLATDKEGVAFTVIAVLCLVSYSVFIAVQLIFTKAELYKYATIFSIIFLPKSISPKFEFFDMLTRDEVLANWKPQKYLKEKTDSEEAKERKKQQDALKIKRDNEQLLQKYPNLPSLLLFNVPEEGVPQMFPNRFPLLPTDDGYVSEWNRMMMQYSWTEKYMACRRTGMDVDESIKTTKDVYIDADNYIGNLTLGGLLTWSDWENRMRTMDNFPKDILQKHRIKDPFLPVTESISPLDGIEISALRPCNGETLHERIVRAPPVRLKMQERKMLKKWEETLKERNAPFDDLYWDDPIVGYLSELVDKETIAAVLNVKEAEIESPKYAKSMRPISMNPRKRPLDEFWLDPDMPGFIGPHNLSPLDEPVFDPNIRTRRFLNKIMDRQWKKALDDDLEFELAMLHLRSKGYSLMNFFA